MKPNPLPFIREKWAGVPQPTSTFSNQIIVITGANVGLGFEAALKFTFLDAKKVILAVRSVLKGSAAVRTIEERTKRKGVVEVWKLDMESYASIQEFARRVSNELPRLDVAILNAGISPKDYILGPEGWESTLQVNVLGTALLGLSLLPKLKSSRTAEGALSHLVIVTSEAHRWLEAKDFPDATPFGGNMLEAVNAKPANGQSWNGMLQNARSKLFGMYITEYLAGLAVRADGNGELDVIVNSVCPGACRSELTRDFKGLKSAIALGIFDLLFNKTAEQGARAYVNTAALDKKEQGKWYKTMAVTEQGELVTSEEGKNMQKQVLKDIVQALGAERLAIEGLDSKMVLNI